MLKRRYTQTRQVAAIYFVSDAGHRLDFARHRTPPLGRLRTARYLAALPLRASPMRFGGARPPNHRQAGYKAPAAICGLFDMDTVRASNVYVTET